MLEGKDRLPQIAETLSAVLPFKCVYLGKVPEHNTNSYEAIQKKKVVMNGSENL